MNKEQIELLKNEIEFLEMKMKENIANTIITTEGTKPTCNFIIIPEATKKGYAKAYDGDGVYINRPHQKRGVVQKGMIQTLKTSCNDVGVVVKNNLKTKLCNDLIKMV